MFAPMHATVLIPLLVAMFLAMNMGASGTAPSFSAAYGSNLLRREAIPGLLGLFVFAGAILAGKKVVQTVGSGILPAESMTLVLTTIVLLSVAIALLIANLLRIPQSTSQATVFALVAPALIFRSLETRKLLVEIIPTWFILPVASFAITLGISLVYYRVLKAHTSPWLARFSGHSALRVIVILASCYVAFAIGSNNVANAAGPVASMLLNELSLGDGGASLELILIVATLIIAPEFGVGSSVLGERVTETTAKQIVPFGPLGATLIAVITATLLLTASVSRGIPTSLVQTNTAAIMGLGIAKVGWHSIATRGSVRKLFTIWLISPLIAMAISGALTAIAIRAGLL